MTRYRHIPLSDARLKHYEKMRFHVTKKPFGEYTDADIDIAEHCQRVRIPYFIIHCPRRYCSIELDWSVAGIELTLPGHHQVQELAQAALDRSSAPKSKRVVYVTPRALVAHGLEMEHAKKLCQHVWEWMASEAPAIRGDPGGGDAA